MVSGEPVIITFLIQKVTGTRDVAIPTFGGSETTHSLVYGPFGWFQMTHFWLKSDGFLSFWEDPFLREKMA